MINARIRPKTLTRRRGRLTSKIVVNMVSRPRRMRCARRHFVPAISECSDGRVAWRTRRLLFATHTLFLELLLHLFKRRRISDTGVDQEVDQNCYHASTPTKARLGRSWHWRRKWTDLGG